jgi:uncharacterized RDD family membrane protein YckC
MNRPNQDYLEGLANHNYGYATFWQRVWASLIDIVVLVPVYILGVTNNNQWKSLALMICLNIITIGYKPIMEYKFGATAGKMLTKISVLNYEYQPIQMSHSLLRNTFQIIPGIYSLLLAWLIYLLPEFQLTTTLDEYNNLSNSFINEIWYIVIVTVIFIADILFLFSDPRNRTLHDRMGQTVVVQKKFNVV